MDEIFRKLLRLFEELGLWKDGVALIGSWSFLLYQRHLGVRPLPLRTQDIDFLLPRPYPAQREVDLTKALEDLGFRVGRNSDGSNYFMHPELKLEFLSPERGKGDSEAPPVKALGVRASSLRFMDMLLKDSIIVRESGIDVRVPRPLAFCLHKLVIGQRRTKRDKREKDIQQAIYALEIVKPEELARALEALPAKWKQLARKSLSMAWDLFPLERWILERHGLAPRS